MRRERNKKEIKHESKNYSEKNEEENDKKIDLKKRSCRMYIHVVKQIMYDDKYYCCFFVPNDKKIF